MILVFDTFPNPVVPFSVFQDEVEASVLGGSGVPGRGRQDVPPLALPVPPRPSLPGPLSVPRPHPPPPDPAPAAAHPPPPPMTLIRFCLGRDANSSFRCCAIMIGGLDVTSHSEGDNDEYNNLRLCGGTLELKKTKL